MPARAEAFQINYTGLVGRVPAATDVDVEVGATEILSYASSLLNESNRLVHSLVKVKVNELGGRAETVSVNVD